MTGTYNIRDDDGNLLGTLDAQSDGSIAIEHAGSGEQAVLDDDGLTVPAVNAGSIGNSGSAVEFTDVIHSPSNSNPQKVLEIGDTGRLIGSDKITLSDDESVVIRSGASFGIPGYVLIRNDDDLEGATFTFAGNNTNLEISEGSFAASDSDSNVCVFVDSNEDLILKNRLGSSKTFRVVGISI